MCKEGYGCNVGITKQVILNTFALETGSYIFSSLSRSQETKQGWGKPLSFDSWGFSYFFLQFLQMIILIKHGRVSKKFHQCKMTGSSKEEPTEASLHYKQRWGCSLISTEMHVCSKPMRKHTLTAKSKRDSLKNLHSRTLLRLAATEMPWLVPKSNTAKLFSSKGRM